MLIMKPCLKLRSPVPRPCPDPIQKQKSVSFIDDSDNAGQIFWADEYDRTPSEPVHHLSYSDMLELKAIQGSLPRANQPSDPFCGRQGSSYLSKVPIGLLPLLPDAEPCDSSNNSTDSSSVSTPDSQSPSPLFFEPSHCRSTPFDPRRSSESMVVPPHLSHLQQYLTPPQPRKQNFSFLPLLEPTTSHSNTDLHDFSDQDPPTPSLTNASLDSSPMSRASSSPEPPPFFLLPPSRNSAGDPREVMLLPPAIQSLRLEAVDSPVLPPPSPLSLNGSCYSSRNSSPDLLGKAQPIRRRNIMFINGEEVDLEDDEEEPRSRTPNAECTPTLCSRSTFVHSA